MMEMEKYEPTREHFDKCIEQGAILIDQAIREMERIGDNDPTGWDAVNNVADTLCGAVMVRTMADPILTEVMSSSPDIASSLKSLAWLGVVWERERVKLEAEVQAFDTLLGDINFDALDSTDNE